MSFIHAVIMFFAISFAIMAIEFDSLVASVLSMAGVGLMLSILFLMLQAPDVAMAEASIGSALVMFIYIIVIRKTKGREEK